MSILFSGDFHASERQELSIITKNILINKYGQERFNAIRYHIILGDGGFMWHGNHKADIYNYETLAHRSFPILCVIGNHEPILGMKDLNEIDIGIGETVYKINDEPFNAYLKRGKIYTIDGIRFLVLGGALSIDKDRRTPDISWWKNEYWDEQEKRDVFNLLKSDNTFDFVLSHTGPDSINEYLFKKNSNYYAKSKDEVAVLNDNIRKSIHFKEWWCGHWHDDIFYYDNKNQHGYQYLYKTTKIIEKKGGKFIILNEYDEQKR